MSHLSIQFHVAAPPEVVWEHVADPARLPGWSTFVGRVIGAIGQPGVVGSSFTAVQDVAGRPVENRYLVRTAEPPRRIETSGSTPGGWTRLRTTIEPDGEGGSNVMAEVDYELPGTVMGAFRGQLSGNAAEREFRRSYDRLRALLDRRPADPGPA